ncbi:hypothetical protein TVAG_353950 [Trichomonas vaginalis G3]|uniref:Armadillo/beta-catenin-like repeat family protein n=1 Tax=Trichomonas vaginalis (strain ATCC PRA-98 / G3) TaxID=412133 RepID=A2FH15_TRIV3|nr:armadillo repeat containing 2 protein family [Trichomonas vaginalis G3]EAX95783.1 hypothetical protein TVAG_353950 [Trichomonas vaginalis G3]KAI5536547.1 armadillo repeat containing 2 protein family [Trichomonas vaginalis G3]|eukprot:XP_001308713.1 hypothetical protein [Trichomonas vaginalis G3]
MKSKNPSRAAAKLTKPSFAPTSRCQTTKTPRRTVFGLTQVEKTAQLQPDYEIKREIFTPTSSSRKKVEYTPLPSPAKVFIPDTDILEIQELLKRIPKPEDVSDNDSWMVTPVLDRVLGTVGTWSQEIVESLINHEAITELQTKLFALIEVDDFLIRTIICRILLCFSVANSELLSPISRIFYKLSCDENNFNFFVDEDLAGVLLNLLQSQEQEPSVYAAGCIKNTTKSPLMQNKFVELGILDFVIPYYEMDDADPQIISLLSIAIQNLCENKTFRVQLSKSSFISDLASKDDMLSLAMSFIAKVQEVSKENRIAIINKFIENQDIWFDTAPIIEKAFVGIEKEEISGNYVIKMLQPYEEDESEEAEKWILAVNKLALVCSKSSAKNNGIFEKSGVFIKLLKRISSDTNVTISALDVVRTFSGEKNKSIVCEYEKLLGIN